MLIAEAGSKPGGSALVLERRRGKAAAVASRHILLEAERNIRTRLGRNALLRFYQEIASLDLDLVETPSHDESVVYREMIDPKDAHVLAETVKGEAEFLLTLDRKDFMSPKMLQADLPFRIMTPGDFLRHWMGKT